MTQMLSRDMATPRQVTYMQDMCRDREIPGAEKLLERLAGGEVTFAQAKEYIPLMQSFPRKAWERSANPVTEEGLYEHGDLVYRVQRSKSSRNLYALVLDMTLTQAKAHAEAGEKVKATFTYDKGAIFKIDAACRITVERAIELSFHFVNCLVCGRKLTAKQSVERSIGPVCITRV